MNPLISSKNACAVQDAPYPAKMSWLFYFPLSILRWDTGTFSATVVVSSLRDLEVDTMNFLAEGNPDKRLIFVLKISVLLMLITKAEGGGKLPEWTEQCLNELCKEYGGVGAKNEDVKCKEDEIKDRIIYEKKVYFSLKISNKLFRLNITADGYTKDELLVAKDIQYLTSSILERRQPNCSVLGVSLSYDNVTNNVTFQLSTGQTNSVSLQEVIEFERFTIRFSNACYSRCYGENLK